MSNAPLPDTGLLGASEKLGTLAAQHAAEADASRTLSPEIVDGLREAGFARHFVSARWGGREGTFGELTQGVLNVSRGCASTGWCASLLAASSRYAAHLPEAGHEELWGSSPDTCLVTGLVPMGKAEQVDGGHRVTGRWDYISGVDFADWALLCASIPGDPAPELRFFTLPRGSFEVLRTWDCAGMRATGSHTVIVDDVFVPAHLSFARADMEAGRSAWSTQPTHNIPFPAFGGLTFIAPAVGAAEGALKAAAAVLRGKRVLEATQVDLVRASAKIDTSRFLVEQNARVIDERTFAPALLARNQRNAAFAAEQVTEALSGLLSATGTRGMSESGALQRFWRDINAAASHVALRYDITRAAANYANALFEES